MRIKMDIFTDSGRASCENRLLEYDEYLIKPLGMDLISYNIDSRKKKGTISFVCIA